MFVQAGAISAALSVAEPKVVFCQHGFLPPSGDPLRFSHFPNAQIWDLIFPDTMSGTVVIIDA